MDIWRQNKAFCILALIAVILAFVGNNGLAVTDPVESNYVLTAKEMIQAGDYMSPRIFGNFWYDKPILFYWELIAAFQIFGFNSFAARFFPAVFAIAGVFLTYFFTLRLYDKKMAIVASSVLVTSLEYFYISKAVITDMTLFVSFSATLICFYIAYSEDRPLFYYAAYIMAAVSVLTKGPVGLVQPGLIILVFLAWRHDLKALLHMHIFSGLALFFILNAAWYGPMYILHGSDFLLGFLGVHNILRATVSEHPSQNVWYYYILIFLLGFLPWVCTLPLAVKHYQLRQRLCQWYHRENIPKLDMRQQFLISWAAVIVIFYELVATKYITYTLPYAIPAVIGFAAYLRYHLKTVKRMTAFMFILYILTTLFIGIPECRQASAEDVAVVVRQMSDSNTCVTVYGDRYPVSLAYYSDTRPYRLKDRDDIAALLPGQMNWHAKNVMPFMAIEDIPTDKKVIAVVYSGSEAGFEKEAAADGHWKRIKCCGKWVVYAREMLQV
ncbi:MAG: glycosyltransferase family 39 protein [Megasphaera sp.]|jgi:4-amino-4-deoxy-L-arabinose transferase-like glycosyltransferase|nr:glycosyltransferase family 39 protein [Megasphaera sp.]